MKIMIQDQVGGFHNLDYIACIRPQWMKTKKDSDSCRVVAVLYEGQAYREVGLFKGSEKDMMKYLKHIEKGLRMPDKLRVISYPEWLPEYRKEKK